MPLFPLFLKLDGQICIVVGGGRVAESKIASLLAAGARVRVVAPAVTDEIAVWHEEGTVEWKAGCFEPADLEGAFLVVAATPVADVNAEVFRLATQKRILCNVVDDPGHCHFYYGAVVQRGALQIAISTAGASPALAQRLRAELEREYGPEYGPWLDWLGTERTRIHAEPLDPEEKRIRLHQLASPEGLKEFLGSLTPRASHEEAT